MNRSSQRRRRWQSIFPGGPGMGLVVAVVVLALTLTPAPVLAATTDLRVMSFNVRTGAANDGANNWDNRKDFVVQTVETFNPDLLGLQEDLRYQGIYIQDGLTGYGKIGRGKNADGSSEYNAILWKQSRFTKLGEGHFWLSTTPDVAGSVSWDADQTRMAEWIELRDKLNPALTFVLMNTHWDHVGDEARFQSARLTRSKITELFADTPVILTGDFNADQGGRAYRRMMGLDDADNHRDFIDTYREIHPDNSDTVGTAHGFDGTAGDGRIDWILHDDAFDTINASIVRTSYNGRYPSDHFPVTSVIRPVAVPEPAGLAVLGLMMLGLRRRQRRHPRPDRVQPRQR